MDLREIGWGAPKNACTFKMHTWPHLLSEFLLVLFLELFYQFTKNEIDLIYTEDYNLVGLLVQFSILFT
jgi:hypothetical protein